MLLRTIPTYSSCYNDSEKSILWPIYDHDVVPFCSYWRKGQMLNFWLYRGQTGKNDPILLAMVSKCLSSKYNKKSYEMLRYYAGYATKTVSQWTLTFSLHNHATHSKLFWIWNVFTRRAFWDHCQQNWGIFTCLIQKLLISDLFFNNYESVHRR